MLSACWVIEEFHNIHLPNGLWTCCSVFVSEKEIGERADAVRDVLYVDLETTTKTKVL